jgi:peptide/nickel transport system permease protein
LFVSYLIRRVLMTIPAMLAMSIVVFFIVRLVPGDPAQAILGVYATPESVAAMREDLHLDEPIIVQYLRWLGGVVQGDLGENYQTNEAISDQLISRLPVTIELTLLAMLISAAISIPLGSWAAMRGGWAEGGSTGLGFLGVSIPDFWLGVMFILTFSLYLGWLPSFGFVPLSESVRDNLRHMVLPSITLALSYAAVLTRTTRGAVLETLDLPFVSTARAKGLKERRVLMGHVLRNSAIPIVTVIGLQMGYALGGAVIIEQVFSLPGIGRLTLDAVLARDYPLIQGAVLLITFMFMLVNIVTDAIHGLLDPRVRMGDL